MPQFFPEYADSARRKSDSFDLAGFLRGYLGAAEWLANDDMPDPETGEYGRLDDRRESRRDVLKGWTRKAQVEARRDCRDFMRANAADLVAYAETTKRDMESAGMDFFLSRNGHGAGFFDRGNNPALDRLQDAARGYGDAEAAMSRGGWLRWQ